MGCFYIAVCDDNEKICSLFENTILKYSKTRAFDLEVSTFCSGEELYRELIMGEKFDLIFLDIEFSKDEKNGVEIGNLIRNQLKNELVQLVYMSGKEDYYKPLFEVRPMHFLLKPISEEKIFADIDKALELSNISEKVFVFKQGHRTKRIFVRSILYFETVGRKIRIQLVDGEEWFYGTMEYVFIQLGSTHFFSPHNSYFVKYEAVKAFSSKRLILNNGDVIPVSRNQSKAVMQVQLQYER